MADSLLRLYGAAECGPDGYPFAWHRSTAYGVYSAGHSLANPAIKDLIREQAGHRCVRCGHPYLVGEHEMECDDEGILVSWTPCDENCTHGGPVRYRFADESWCDFGGAARDGWQSDQFAHALAGAEVQARARILTVHHLDEDKANCCWWNLAALCQRCHLSVQGHVKLRQLYVHPHSEWFKPYAAGYYASTYLGEELTRDETIARLDDLLALELDPSYRA